MFTGENTLIPKVSRCFDTDTPALAILLAMMAAAVINAVIMCCGLQSVFVILFGLVGCLALLAVVLYVVKDIRAHRTSLKLWDIALLIMLLWATVSAVCSPVRQVALLGTLYRNDGLYSYVVYAALYILARRLESNEHRRLIVRGYVLTISLISLMSVSQVIWGVPAQSMHIALYAGSLANINHYAYLLCMAVAAAAGLVFIEKRFTHKLIALFLMGFNMWALLVNTTMGSFLAALLGAVFLTVVMLVRDKHLWREAAAVIVMLLSVNLTMELTTGCISDNFLASFTGIDISEGGIEIEDSAGSSRIGLWRQAVQYIGERPILGFGPEGLHERYYADGFNNDRPHNEYLQHAVFLGIPGAVCYLTALISLFTFNIRRTRKLELLQLGIGSVIFTYCASAFFGNTMYYSVIYYFMMLGLLAGGSIRYTT